MDDAALRVTYEALACGLPIITTPNAGSVARDGVEGFIVSIRDGHALCARLQRLRDDVALREQLGRAARARAEEFSWSRFKQSQIVVFQRVRQP